MSDNGTAPGFDPLPPDDLAAPAAPLSEPAPTRRWYHYALTSIFALFCVELGILLVLLPWLDLYENDFLSYVPAAWRAFFFSYPFRGAVSGLGFLNILVALNDVIEMLRPPRARR